MWLIRARYYDSSGQYIGQETAASGGPDSLTKAWQRKGDVITTPANAATVRVRLYNYMNSGWVAFDDVVLAPVVVTSYYYLGARRVAMRQGDSVYYIVGDHLGTTHLVLDAQGNKVAERRLGSSPSLRGTAPLQRSPLERRNLYNRLSIYRRASPQLH